MPGPGLLPDVEIEVDFLSLQQRAPVDEENPPNDGETEHHQQDSLQGQSALQDSLQVRRRVARGEDHDGVAQELAEEERRKGSRRADLGHSGGGEQGRRGQRGQRVDEDEAPR